MQLVQCIEVGAGRGDDDIGIRPIAIDDTIVPRPVEVKATMLPSVGLVLRSSGREKENAPSASASLCSVESFL